MSQNNSRITEDDSLRESKVIRLLCMTYRACRERRPLCVGMRTAVQVGKVRSWSPPETPEKLLV
jgi:hypothetical protein